MGAKAREARRAAAIHAYVGPNGGGKSLAMVYDSIPSLQAGRRVLSTVRLLDPETGEPHPLYVPLTTWEQLLSFEGGDLLLDEVQGVVSSRAHQSLPPAVLTQLLQMRRRDVVVRWTAPSYARADVVLREVTLAVTYCKGYRPVYEGAKLWGANRTFYWRTYDALSFDEFSAGKRDQLKPLKRQVYSRLKDDAQGWYDTGAPVDYITDATEAGTCLVCGGHRRRPTCKCESASGGAEHAPKVRAQVPRVARPSSTEPEPDPSRRRRPARVA